MVPDGEPVATRSGRLLPMRRGGVPAMLKVAVAPEEAFGARLMAWWDGRGAARVLAQEGDAILLERAEGKRSLADLARDDRDDEACRVLCAAIAELHAPRAEPPPDLVPLDLWFADLFSAAAARGGVLAASADAARELLADPREVGALHGDMHHGNVLDFGEGRGWLAIDPKGIIGERAFDYANLFCNPDHETATAAPGRLARRAGVVAEAAKLERGRLLRWVLAWAGLSAAWLIEDGEPPCTRLAIAELAAAELGRR